MSKILVFILMILVCGKAFGISKGNYDELVQEALRSITTHDLIESQFLMGRIQEQYAPGVMSAIVHRVLKHCNDSDSFHKCVLLLIALQFQYDKANGNSSGQGPIDRNLVGLEGYDSPAKRGLLYTAWNKWCEKHDQ
jgi:hypothetical protein